MMFKTIFRCDHGTVQGLVMRQVLFSLFIRPLDDLEELLTYANDNYFGESDDELMPEITRLLIRMERAIGWLKITYVTFFNYNLNVLF